MSAENIQFDGEDLARRVPLLGQSQTDLESVAEALVEIAACRWADGVPNDDTTTLQARDAVHGMLAQYVFPAYGQCGAAFGFQGEKLGLFRRIGDNTEDTNTETAGGWGGRRG